jgi:hypothetical protein
MRVAVTPFTVAIRGLVLLVVLAVVALAVRRRHSASDPWPPE